MFDRLNSGAAESPSSMSLGRVMDSMNAVRSRSGSGGSDRASSRDTITVSSNPGNNPNIKHNPSSKRASMIDERDRSEGDMRQQSYDIDGGNTNEQQNLKRRRVDDQMSSLSTPILSSCETCKHRKVKCDRTQPSCVRCQRSKQECIYKQKKKPGLRAGIGRELEERLDRVESVLASHARMLEAHSQQLPSPNSLQSSPTSPVVYQNQVPQLASPITNGGGTYPSHVPGSRTEVQFTSDNRSDIPVSPSTNSDLFRDRGNSTCVDQDGHAKFPSKIRASSSTKSFDPDLPSDDILFSLIEIFFAQVQPGCPILHRQTLLDSYFARPVAEQEKEDIILLFAISAAALRFSTDKRLDYEYKNQFKTLAKQKVIFNALENPSIQSLRAMVIIVLDVVGSTNGPSGWGLLALTTRMAIHLGLNTEPSNSPAFLMNGGSKELPSISTWGVGMLPEPRDWIEQEGRRRLFWMVYVLDIYTSLGTSLDLTLDENEIERLLPCQDEIWDRNQPTTTRWFRTPARQFDNTVSNVGSLSSFSFLVEILGLLGRIHRFLRKAIDINNLSDVEAWQLKYRELDKAMMTWKLSLPMQFGNLIRALNVGPSTNSVDPGWVLLHAAYNTAVIRLHSVAAYPTNRSSIFGPSYSAGQRCLSAVQNIAALTRLVLDNNMISQLGSTFAFTLWVSARVLLVHASTTQVPIIPDIRLFLDALHEMGRIYETAERYASILQRVFDELEAAAGDGAFNIFGKVEVDEPSTKTGVENGSGDGATSATTTGADAKRSSCVAILADMRRTAYAVDVLISRQPNSNKLKTVNSTYEIRTSSGFVNNVYNHINYGLQGSNGHAHSTVNNPSLVGQPPFSPNQQQQASNLLGAGISMGTNSHAIEFLDVFNWFNMPRVPMGSQAYFDTGGGLAVNGAGSAGDTQLQGFASLTGTGVTAAGSAENGVTDWLFREG